MYDSIELLATLSNLPGPSGHEEEVRKFVLTESTKHTKRISADSMGNVFAEIQGTKGSPRVLVSAHMDEVGFIVTYVEDSGFLRFATLGRIDTRVLPGQRVVFQVSEGLHGIIGSKPPHALTPDEVKKSLELRDLYIDIGASSRADVTKLGIGVGSVATFDMHFTRTGSKSLVMGKAFDDRAGCTAALMAMEFLSQNPPSATTVFAFTVQEEVGMRGAKVAAEHVHPQAAVVLETTAALDCPDVEPRDRLLSLGLGPALRVMDASMITQKVMLGYVSEVAEKNRIPYQFHVSLGASTEAGPVHLSGEGVPTCVLSTPCRYLHSPALVLNIEDLNKLPKLVEAVIRGIDQTDKFAYIDKTREAK
ncbi:MAG: M42 family metallopeptidase [Candidatus Bathyarchaeia archaeon]